MTFASSFTDYTPSVLPRQVYCYHYFGLPPTQKWLVWDKGQRINQSDGELAWTSMSGALRIFTLNRVELMRDGAVHPTQKPEALMRWCIGQAGDPATVFDPFMGSGSTLVAAKRLGKKAVGIEREERYCELAVRRLRQEALPLGEARNGEAHLTRCVRATALSDWR